MALMRRLATQPVEYDLASDSNNEEEVPDNNLSLKDEAEGKENTPSASAWVAGTHNITLTPCIEHATVVLPGNRTRTELGYFRSFVPDTLNEIIVLNTIEYAKTLRGDATFTTDAAEIWRYIAARIRMGIVRLPETHMYWQAEYRDSYVTQLFTRDHFEKLQRYWLIAPPTPAGETHNAVQKIGPLYHHC